MPIPSLNKRGQRQYGRLQPNQLEPVQKPRRFSTRHLKKLPKPNRKIIRKLITLMILLGVFGFVGATGTVFWASKDLPDPNKLIERKVSQSTKIYDRTGENLLYEIYQDQKRTLIELDQIPDYAKKATVAIEDKHFYTHKGIRIQSIIRAGVNNLLGRKVGAGGASTLTQQLIKNAVVGNEHSYLRKIKEAVLAIRLEKKYSKDEILKLYLNEIPYGSTNYGIEAASQSYFKKSAKDLTLAESATLAAIPKAPSYYLNNLKALSSRRDTVLKLMYDQGQITEQQKNNAQNTPLKFYSKAGGVLEAPHFVLYVKQLLADSFGEKTVDEGGLKVITTLDYDKQKIAEKAIKEIGEINAEKNNANNAALVAMDPKTGEVLSMVGSRDFDDDTIDGKFNVAVLGKRQPGSSFKPFIYLAAFAKGFTPETVLYDVETDFEKDKSKKPYIPKNYTGKNYGLVTLRQALQGSLNITAVKALYLVGADSMIKLATEKFGYTTLTGDYGLSLVLGGAEVTLLEHTTGYATLANEGVYHKPITILKVEDHEGKEIFKAKKSKGTEAIDKKYVATLSSVLSDDKARAYMFGENSQLTLPGRPVAAKTGTTDDSKDAWTMGYTPSLVAGVWVGNSQPSTMKGGGSMLAGPIWNKFMREALDKTAVEQFPEPPKNEATNPFLKGAIGGITLRINKKTGKIASSSTPDEMVIEKTYLPPHTLLHYIDKNDPTASGQTSQNDPQYETWEESLKKWIEKQKSTGSGITLQDPPTEHDTTGSIELLPSLKVISPLNSSTINSRLINFKVEVSAPRGVSEVNYYYNGIKIGSSYNHPFDFTYNALKQNKGIHSFKVIAQDDQGNSTQETVTIDLQAEFAPPSFEWIEEKSLNKDNFPRAIYLIPYRWSEIKTIQIYLKSDSSEKLIYTFDQSDNLLGNKLTFTWNNYPGAGGHTLRGVMLDKKGRRLEKQLNIQVQ